MNIKRKFSHSVSVNQPESSVCRSPRTKGPAANANTSGNTLCDLEGGKNGDDILLLSDKLKGKVYWISVKNGAYIGIQVPFLLPERRQSVKGRLLALANGKG